MNLGPGNVKRFLLVFLFCDLIMLSDVLLILVWISVIYWIIGSNFCFFILSYSHPSNPIKLFRICSSSHYWWNQISHMAWICCVQWMLAYMIKTELRHVLYFFNYHRNKPLLPEKGERHVYNLQVRININLNWMTLANSQMTYKHEFWEDFFVASLGQWIINIAIYMVNKLEIRWRG
jgi:hypothetical protein